MTFIHIMSILLGIAGAGSVYVFRKGGIYNPVASTDTQPSDEYPIKTSVPSPSAPLSTADSPDLPQDASLALYATSHSLLGEHLTLDDSIPAEVGCAQALSTVLIKCGYPIPTKGISTVAGLTDWMLANGFHEATQYKKGLVTTGRAPDWAHIGITGNDWIMSNTSNTLPAKGLTRGMWQANYQKDNWYRAFPIVKLFTPPLSKTI